MKIALCKVFKINFEPDAVISFWLEKKEAWVFTYNEKESNMQSTSYFANLYVNFIALTQNINKREKEEQRAGDAIVLGFGFSFIQSQGMYRIA